MLVSHARVTLMVEVTVGPWDGTTSFDNLYKQASEEAAQLVRCAVQRLPEVRIVGEPKTTMILVEKEP